MKIAYFFFLLITVPLGRCEDDEDFCIELYGSCVERFWTMRGGDPCRIADEFLKCLVNATELCIPPLKDTIEKYHILIEDGCRPGSTFFPDVSRTLECLSNNPDPFQGCILEGEFDNVAEVCSSVANVIDCSQLKAEILCGRKSRNVFSKLLRPVHDLLDDCKSSQDTQDVELDACYKGLLSCDRHILTRLTYTCSQVERTGRCYVSVADEKCELDEEGVWFLKIVRRYVDQIPDYCNRDSAIMQNIQKSEMCIARKFKVLDPCNDNFENALTAVFEGGEYDSKESELFLSRALIKYRDCSEDKLRTACGEETAFVIRYVLEPLAVVSEEMCMEQTGEKCNGATTVQCTILLLILSLQYILMKEE